MSTLVSVILLIVLVILCFELVRIAIRRENLREDAIEKEKAKLKSDIFKKDEKLKELDVLLENLKPTINVKKH